MMERELPKLGGSVEEKKHLTAEVAKKGAKDAKKNKI
jgi:hypothetical protein